MIKLKTTCIWFWIQFASTNRHDSLVHFSTYIICCSLKWNSKKPRTILKYFPISLAHALLSDLKQTFLCKSCLDFFLYHEKCHFLTILDGWGGGAMPILPIHHCMVNVRARKGLNWFEHGNVFHLVSASRVVYQSFCNFILSCMINIWQSINIIIALTRAALGYAAKRAVLGDKSHSLVSSEPMTTSRRARRRWKSIIGTKQMHTRLC